MLLVCADESPAGADADAELNPYSNPLVMPLADFIEHPLAHELVHNGAAYQVCHNIIPTKPNSYCSNKVSMNHHLTKGAGFLLCCISYVLLHGLSYNAFSMAKLAHVS